VSLAQLPPRAANVPIAAAGSAITVEPVDLVAADGAPSSGLLYAPRAGQPRVGIHLMHPRTDQTRNYNVLPLVSAGCMVLARNGRSVNNDADTLHEDLLLDVAAGVGFLRTRGCEAVVLLGNSGGGALAALYQSQAEAAPGARIKKEATVSGVDLARASLPSADALIIVGGHMGQGKTLAKLIDGAVVDESDPLSVDPAADIYDPRNGFRLPVSQSRYLPEFVAVVRTAQLRRVERIDRLARSAIAAAADARSAASWLRDDGGDGGDALRARLWVDRRAAARSYLTIYRTIADPVILDPTIEPDDRVPGGFDGYQRPDLQNYRQVGFAHLVSPRAWLSTWSALSSHADLAGSIGRVTVPTLVVHYRGDLFTRLSEAEKLRHAAGTADFSLVIVGGADHYGRRINPDGSVGARTTEGTDAAVSWLRKRFAL
jgi:pimeloyl-ACP methyl ester carboxylesterase